jgi:predicted esterase
VSVSDNAFAVLITWQLTSELGGFILVTPQASGVPNGGWVLGGASDDLPKITAVINQLSSEYNIDKSRIYGWGFSSGAHVMHKWVLGNNALASAYTAQAGALLATSSTTAPASSPRKVPVLLRHGTLDPTVPYVQATNDKARFLAAGWLDGQNFLLSSFDGEHTFSENDVGIAWEFMCRWAVRP